ncbi:MAG: VanW family protein [Clostridia bacterium]|nr:VanW family protein [Clostridia bacterium]
MSKKKQKETKEEKKDLIKVEEPEKPTLVQEIERKQKKNLFIIINIVIILILIGIFSIIFAFMNVTKSVIVNGVSIKNIDVSNLTMQEAKAKLEEALNIELNTPIKLTTDEYETTLNTSQIEFKYDIAKAVEKAYSVGRSGNIIQNNYEILSVAFWGKEITPEYTYNEDTLNYIVDSIESKIPGLVVQATYYKEGSELIIIPGKDGITVNKEEFKKYILNKIVEQDALQILENKNNTLVSIPIQQTKADSIDIEKIYSEVYTEPKDAYYEENPFKIYAEVEGVDFAISKEEAKSMVATVSEEYRIPLKLTPANKTINDIGTEAFPYLISTYTTRYDASNVNRSQNLAIATGKINGTVLMPGEEFSFNQVVGKRTIEEGYKDAKIYQDGKVVDGLAGGICQISSTLYNAVIKANLEIVERRNHSFTTSYVKAGRDATVVYGVIDFKFKNTRTYPIKIEGSVGSGVAEFNIYGIKEEVEYSVDLAPVVTASIPYATQYIPDPTLAPGQQIIVQAGGNGCKVTTYKETKLDGKFVSKEIISTDTYQPMKAIIRIGP